MYEQQNNRHNIRFYIVLITLLIGGIFFILLMNDNSKGLDFTSAIIGAPDENIDLSADSTVTEADSSFTKSSRGTGRELEFNLFFDTVPVIKETVDLVDLELRTIQVDSDIKVNGDNLDLSSTGEVTLILEGFTGKMALDGQQLSLVGTAKKLVVNGMTLSSKAEIKISFSGLYYDSLNLNNLGLEQLALPSGSGSIIVAEKLNYDLVQEKAQLAYFLGQLVCGNEGGSTLELHGSAKGIKLSGDTLNVELK